MAHISAMIANATRVCRETVNGSRGIGTTSSGTPLVAAGTKRPRYDANTTALVAIAPEKPATNDVQPVRNATPRPNAASR